MRVLLQRVNQASVTVDNKIVGQINRGLLLLVGFGEGDDESKLKPMATKISEMRIFEDEKSKFNHSVLDIKGEILCVPQFTLYANTSKGRRPDFFGALKPDLAAKLFDEFTKVLQATGVSKMATGVFGAYMKVNLENDGPVTIMVEV